MSKMQVKELRFSPGHNIFSPLRKVRFLSTWFIDEATRMNPNLNYGQMLRGPGGRPGSPTGIL